MTDPLISLFLDVLIRSTLLLCAAWVITSIMIRRSAAERHLVWLLAIAGVVAMPLFTAIGPRIELAVPAPSAIDAVTTVLDREVVQPVEAAFAVADSSAAAAGTADTTASEAAWQVESAPAAAIRMTFAEALLLIYALGAAVLALRYFGMRIRLARHLRRLSLVRDHSLTSRFEEVRSRVGVARSVRLLHSEHDHSPWAWGATRPQLVLPADFSRWCPDQQRSAFLHELAHVARNDHLTGMLAQACCVIHWFNPLVWLAVRALLLEAEKACDDRVINAGGSASAYADQLLQIAGRIFRNKDRSVWVSAMAHRSSLTPRIRSILDPNKRRSAMSRTRTNLFVLAASVVVIPLAALHSQEPALSLGDLEFQTLVQNGPNGSAELERIVNTYVENDLQEFAADAIARFITHDYGTLDEHGWEFCIDVLSSEGTPRQHERFPVVVAAFELLHERARSDGNGSKLLQAVLNNFTSTGNSRSMNRAMYYVVAATQLGVEDQLRLGVATFLYEKGSVTEARDLVTYLYNDENSVHYQTDVTSQWVKFLNGEVLRRQTLTNMIFTSLGVLSEPAEGEYLPLVKTAPVYPADAAEQRVEGSVIVEFTVNTEGVPENVHVVSSTNAVFNASAVAAARNFRYAPRIVAGTPVSVPGVRNKLTYKLED